MLETITIGKKSVYRSVPDGALKIKEKNGLGVVYVQTINGKILVKGFAGNAGKPAFYYSYRSQALAEQKIKEFFGGLVSWKQRVIERRKADNSGHSLKVGQIITNSWGYDQTNVDWYQIVKTSNNYVWLQPIHAQVDEQTGAMSGQSSPVIDVEGDDPSKWGIIAGNGKIERHKASGTTVTMKYGCGSLWDGRKMYTSWYA